MAKTQKQGERPLPSNPEAEKSILGAILLNNAAYVDAADLLRPDDFSLDSHRRIFARMVELGEAGRAIDLLPLEEVWYCYGCARWEHQWARNLGMARGVCVPLAGFGASECRCESHLYFFKNQPSRSRLP